MVTVSAYPKVKKLLSIVVPVFNEEENIEPFYEQTTAVLERLADQYDWEFVFTDNHSTDKTFECLQALARRDKRVRAFRFTRNFGFQRSILTGYRLANGAAAIQIDCDLQDPPGLIPEFLTLWRAGYKVVYGVRKSRPEAWWLRTLRQIFYQLINALSDHPLPRNAGDFRLIDREIITLLHEYSDEQPYLRGYNATLAFKQVGIEYDRSERLRGKSGFTFGQMMNLALDGIVSHSILPLRLASLIGITVFAIAVFSAIVYVVLRLTYSAAQWPAGFATVVILILVSMAVNAIFLGILGEYVARIYRQVKRGPLTIVERFIEPEMMPNSERYYISAGIAMPRAGGKTESQIASGKVDGF
jgi:glycosyltransferase involved in cell wall biosynthesis